MLSIRNRKKGDDGSALFTKEKKSKSVLKKEPRCFVGHESDSSWVLYVGWAVTINERNGTRPRTRDSIAAGIHRKERNECQLLHKTSEIKGSQASFMPPNVRIPQRQRNEERGVGNYADDKWLVMGAPGQPRKVCQVYKSAAAARLDQKVSARSNHYVYKWPRCS